VGDDLTVTNPALIKQFAGYGAVNAVIIKPNQIEQLLKPAKPSALPIGKILMHSFTSLRRDGDAAMIHIARAGGVYGGQNRRPCTREDREVQRTHPHL